MGYNDVTDAHRANKVFTDAWGQPVLYYRARRAASIMVTNPTGSTPTPGVYDQRDNVVYTGGNVAGVPPDGLDFGSGATHRLNVSAYPVADPNVDNLDAATYNGGVPTFEQFIWNRDIPQRNVPVNKESFLLISAGPDALYGTADDITNWARD